MRFGISGTRLDALGKASPVQERWAHAMQILVATQAHAATAFGYEATGPGVMLYRNHWTSCLQTAPAEVKADLESIESEVWAEVLLRGFALPPKPMSLETARAFATAVQRAVDGDAAISKSVAEAIETLPADEADRDAKAMQLVQSANFEMQKSLAPELGYDGDDGFVQLQAALVLHVMTDPVVMHTTSASMHTLCHKAGVKPPF